MIAFSNIVTHHCTKDQYWKKRKKKKTTQKTKSKNTEPWPDLQLWMQKEGAGGEEGSLGTARNISVLFAKPSHFSVVTWGSTVSIVQCLAN